MNIANDRACRGARWSGQRCGKRTSLHHYWPGEGLHTRIHVDQSVCGLERVVFFFSSLLCHTFLRQGNPLHLRAL